MIQNKIMNKFSFNNFSLGAAHDREEDDDDRQYERQALIFDDDRIITSNSDYELKALNNKTYKDINSESNGLEFTYYDIQAGDSLQSICLRYACPVNHVKRLNGLMTDQDFHGLRRLKLPLGKLGLLEDVIKQQNGSQDLLMSTETKLSPSRPRLVNSPGSALSIANRNANPRFKPLLSSGSSSDRIIDLNRNYDDDDSIRDHSNLGIWRTSLPHNSHSFSSLTEFSNGDTNIDINNTESSRVATGKNVKFLQQNFIKPQLVHDLSEVTIDNLLTDEQPKIANVFEDLDYHVERAKVAAEGYEQRAAQIVSDIGSTNLSGLVGPRASKIPDLFFSGENFGLNIKRLVILIVFVCLVIPLVYISQANHVR